MYALYVCLMCLPHVHYHSLFLFWHMHYHHLFLSFCPLKSLTSPRPPPPLEHTQVLINWIPKDDPEIDHLGQPDADHDTVVHGGYSSIDSGRV